MDNGKDGNPLQQLRSLLASGESNEDLLLQFTDLFPALIYVYDAEKKKLRYINKRITDLLGYEWEDVSKWNNDLSELVFSEDRPLVEAELKKYYGLEGHSSHSYNCRLLHKGGDFRYFKTVGTVLRRTEGGSAESMLFLAQDITEQVKGEQEKLAAYALMDETEKMLRMGMWNLDLNSDKMEWSDGMYDLMGYTREEMPVVTHSFYLGHLLENERELVKEKLEESFETGNELRADYSILRKDGSRLFVNSLGKPVRDESGKVISVNGINRDISSQYLQNLEYKANKDMLKQTEQMLRYGVFIWDLQADIAQWTEGLFNIFEMEGVTRQAIINTSWYQSHVLEEDLPRFREALDKAMTDHGTWECDYSIITAKGNLKSVHSIGNIIKTSHGEPVRMVGITRDITSFKKTENELNRNLRELNRSNMELEEFAYAASHDMQEPLRKITTFGSRLKNKYSSLLNEEGRMYIDRMQIASENMRTLIDNLLELSRVSRTIQIFMPVQLDKIVQDSLSDMEITIDETKAEIIIHPLPAIEGIPSQLRQMFTNLISNALKFRKPEIRPFIEISSMRLGKKAKEEHYLLPDRNYIQIDIADNGIGFDQEYENRIFQIFQRLHGKSEYAGSGIGLAICKRIAERHQGLISAKGEEGKGAIFSIILPENQ
ncbi:PAS domain-containing sensor histidine kinase [Flavihumibacter petaseus]|uniref:histidine kinase n=1 Tax=Flavihumibacter petaseus NBRC 106054 TaxID=1220578 RepID=A0A0E9MXJ5_9BACT|nr:PAS domain-containing protein [Flavihumibacter petaseus]GAO42422.1 putative two-component histidine kinase [Flavihumibacter petaseus NBRC 106054]